MKMGTEHRVGIYGWSNGMGGVHHYRIAEPLRVAAENGIRAVTGHVLHNDILETVDTVLAHMLWDERATQAWERLARIGSHRLVLDVDDAMWCPDWRPFKDHWSGATLQRWWRNVNLAHVITTPSPVIAEYLGRRHQNVHVTPNTVPAYLLSLPPQDAEANVVGYQGSPSHERDWPMSQRRQLYRVMAETGARVKFFGFPDVPEGWPAGAVEAVGWQPDMRAYYESLRINIGIGPLRDTKFNAAKSALRAVEYAALGICAVLPDLPPYQGWITDGITGRLVQSHQTLYRVLTEVIGDRDHRERMAAAARDAARAWTTEANLDRWVDAWSSSQ